MLCVCDRNHNIYNAVRKKANVSLAHVLTSFFFAMQCAVILFILSIINLPTFIFFVDPDRDKESTAQRKSDSVSLQASAVCLRKEWVVCLDCSAGDFDGGHLEQKRFGVAHDGTILALRNSCDGISMQSGLLGYVSILLLTLIWLLASCYWQSREEGMREEMYVYYSRRDVGRLFMCFLTAPLDGWHSLFVECQKG